jgi:hypothetical protein
MTNVRIQDKGNVHQRGHKTNFKLFRYNSGAGAFVFDGEYYAPGWNRTDKQCAAYAASCKAEEMDGEE